MTTIQEKQIVKNHEVRDNGSKLIFDDPILCAQFLRGYVDIDLLKDVNPEDIEDISERFLPMWQEGRDSDSVKKIHIKGQSLYLITVIEHRNFKERVYLSDALGKYIPDFEYLVVPLSSYTNEELIEKQDELSLIFLINKLRSSEEFKNLKAIPKEYFDNLGEATPEYLLKLIGKIIAVLLYRMNVPRKEVEEFTDQITRREFEMLFDSFEAYDVQETRRISKEEGKMYQLVKLVCKKIVKGLSVSEIADMLEEDEETIQRISDAAEEFAPDFDVDKIMEKLMLVN